MESSVTPIKFRPKPQKRRRTGDGDSARHAIDFPLFITVCAIALFGVVMLYSATYYKGISESGDGMSFVRSQVLLVAAGIAIMYGVSIVPFGLYKSKRIVIFIYAAIIGLLVYTLINGKLVLGARRWIDFKFFELQPAELAKFGLIICIAYYMSTYPDNMPKLIKGIGAVFAIILPPCVLIYLQPNMSMIIIILAITAVMLYMGGAKLRYFFGAAAVGVPLTFLVVKYAGYRSDRLTAWRYPFENSKGIAYQVVQSMYAFANGGFFGQGFNQSRQKLLFLPEMENDYVLAIIAEELGFIGVLLLIIAYAFVIYRGIRIALRSEDRFAALVAAGISCTLAIQVMINIGVVTNAIPATGQPLPFISKGGTSILVFCGATGILLNISRFMSRQKTPLFGKDK